MSDKESAEDMEVTSQEEVEADQNKNKPQKRKKPVRATPAKKKPKVEKKQETKVEEEKKETATETEEDSEDEELPKGLLERSPEVTGTRVRKQVERLNVTASNLESPARKHDIALGKGVKLGQSPKIVAQLQAVKHTDLHLVHRLLFKRPGSAHEIKKNIKEFSGYPFSKDEKEYDSRKNLLEKNTMADLKLICGIFCLERSGTKEAVVERILEFCLCPNPSTKAVAAKKATKKSKDAKAKATKTKEAKGSKSPIKSPTSKEIIENDSSSSEGEDEADSSAKEEHPSSADEKEEKLKTPAKVKKGETKPKEKKTVTPKLKETKKKPAAAKKSPKKAEIKVKLPAVNKAKKKLSKDSETEDDKDKADTSKEEHSEAESDVEDSPPKKDSTKKSTPAKKSNDPTNDELVDTIKQILKDANLEDMTMKNLCKLVYEKYPDSELEKTRKEFIRSTAKEILGSGV